MTPHPLVVKSIEALNRSRIIIRSCCRPCDTDGEWELCQYHQGMQDGIEAAVPDYVIQADLRAALEGEN